MLLPPSCSSCVRRVPGPTFQPRPDLGGPAGPGRSDAVAQPGEVLDVVVERTALVPVECIYLDVLVRRSPSVVRRENGGRRAHLIHERGREQPRSGGPPSEVHTVEIGQSCPYATLL